MKVWKYQRSVTCLVQTHEGASVGQELDLLGARLGERHNAALHALLADDLDSPIAGAHLHYVYTAYQ